MAMKKIYRDPVNAIGNDEDPRVTDPDVAEASLVSLARAIFHQLKNETLLTTHANELDDNSAFTPGTTEIDVIGGLYNSTRPALTDGRAGAPALTSKRAFYVTPETPNGDSLVDETNDRLKVGMIGTENGIDGGAGAVSAKTVRTTAASDDPIVTRIGEVQASPTSNTVLDRLKALLTGIVLAAGTNVIGFVNLITGQTGITGGAGAVAANTPRTTLASDDPAVASLAVIDDWDESDRAKVNPIAGQVGVQGGSGTVTALTQRTVLATDVALPAGENFLGSVGGKIGLPSVALSLDTAAYASGDVLAETQELPGALRVANGTGILQSLIITDKDDQGAAFDLYILAENVSMGTENSAPSISDANAVNILAIIQIGTGDYKDLGGVKVACLTNLGIPIKSATDTTSLYVAAVNGTGTPTYTVAGLVLRLGILRD